MSIFNTYIHIYIYIYIICIIVSNVIVSISSISDTFDGFESWILYAKPISVMTSTMGRSKRVRSMVITGNRKGLAGFAVVTGREFKPALNSAKNRAGLRLMYIERYNEHTGR